MQTTRYTARCVDCGGACSRRAKRCRSCQEKFRWRDPNDPRRVPPYGLQPGDALWPVCGCGCGEPVPVRKANCTANGHVKGEPCKYVAGHVGRTLSVQVVDGFKRCPKCQETKSVEGFNRADNRPSGYDSWCRECCSEKQRERNKRNPAERARKDRERKALDPEGERVRQRQRMARWRERNYEHHLAQARIYAATRRARVRDQFVEDVDAFVVYNRDGGVCGICGTPVERDDFHVDHIVPLSRGGEHSYRNVQVAHPLCNTRKHNQLQETVAA